MSINILLAVLGALNLIVQKKFVDTTHFQSRNITRDGNVDLGYWFDKSIEERLIAAAVMISVAYNDPNFLKGKVDRTIFSTRRHENRSAFKEL